MRHVKRFIALLMVMMMVLSNLSFSYAALPGQLYVVMTDGSEIIEFPFAENESQGIDGPFGLKLYRDGLFVSDVSQVQLGIETMLSTFGHLPGDYACLALGQDDGEDVEVAFTLTINALGDLMASEDLVIHVSEERMASDDPLATYDGVLEDGISYYLEDHTPVTSTASLAAGNYSMYADKLGYNPVHFVLSVVDQAPEISFAEESFTSDSHLNVTLNALIPYDFLASANDPEDGPIDLFVEAGHHPNLDTSTPALLDVEYSAVDSVENEVLKSRHLNIEDVGIEKGFYILNNLEKLVQKVEGTTYYNHVYTSPLELDLVDAAIDEHGDIYIAVRNNMNTLVNVYNMNDLNTSIIARDNLVAIEFIDGRLYMANADEVFYEANGSDWTQFDPDEPILDFDFDNSDRTMYCMTSDGTQRLYVFEKDQVTHVNSNIPQHANKFIFADESLVFMEEVDGHAHFRVLDELFNEIHEFDVHIEDSYGHTVLANYKEEDIEIYWNSYITNHFMEWEFGSAVWGSGPMMLVHRDLEGNQIWPQVSIVGGTGVAELDSSGMTLRPKKGGTCILKAEYNGHTDYLTVFLIEKQDYYYTDLKNELLESGTPDIIYHMYYTDEHWDQGPDYEDTVQLFRLYYNDEYGERIYLEAECLIDDMPISDTRSLAIGTYNGTFALAEGQTSHYFHLSTWQDHSFVLHVENNPAEVTFYDDPLYVFMDAEASSLLGMYVTDVEGDPFNPVVESDPNGLVDQDMKLNTNNANGGMVTFVNEMTEVSDEIETYTRAYSIEGQYYADGILISSFDGLVHQDMVKDRTYVAYDGSEFNLTDVAINSSSYVVKMFDIDGGYHFLGSDGMNSDWLDYNFTGLSYDFYDDLCTLYKYVEDDVLRFDLISLDIGYGSMESLLDLAAVFDEIGLGYTKFFYVEDIAFDGHDLYILYLASGNYDSDYKVLKLELDRDGDHYVYSGGYNLINLGYDYRYEGIAFYKGNMYVTASKYTSSNSDYFETDMILDSSWIVPLDSFWDEDQMVEISKFFKAASGAAGMVVEDIQMPERIDLEYGLLASQTTYLLEPYVQPFTIELDPENYMTQGDYFSFDPETGIVRATGPMPENGDIGSIYINYNGSQYHTDVYVEEKNPEINFLGPDYIEKDAYVEGDYGMVANMPLKMTIEASYDGITYEDLDSFVLDTSTLGNHRVYYRINEDLSESVSEVYFEFTRNYRVVETDINQVTMHIDMDGILIYRDHLNNRFVYKDDMAYRTGYDFEFDDIAIDGYDVLYLLAGDLIIAYDLEEHDYAVYDEGDWMNGEFDVDDGGFTAIEVGPDEQVYIAFHNQVFLVELNGSNMTYEFYDSLYLADEGWISDLLVSPDNASLYVVSNNPYQMENSQIAPASVIRAAKYRIEDLSIQAYYQEDLPGDYERFVGLTMMNDQLFMDIISEAHDHNRMLNIDHDLNTATSPYEIAHPDYGTFKGACSRYPTIILADDLELHIGYQKTSADGQKMIDYIILPDSRKHLPVSFSVINGSGNASVDQSGLVKGLSAGQATVEISVLNVTKTVDVTVIYHPYPQNDPVIRVSVSPDPIEVEYGPGANPENLSQQANASVSGTNRSVTWTIGDETVATVDEDGLVTAVSTGETTLTASVSGRRDTVDVIVYFIDEELDPLGLVEFNDPYVSGFPDQTFGPKLPVTRAELATMFARILNLDLESQASYKDLQGHWAKDYILAATDANIFKGYTDNTFRPDQAVTRAELAAAISNYWDYFKMEVDSTPRDLTDVSMGFWASTYIYKLYNTELVRGDSYSPNASTLREDVVDMLNTLIGREAMETETHTFSDVLPSNPRHGQIEAASSKALIKGME